MDSAVSLWTRDVSQRVGVQHREETWVQTPESLLVCLHSACPSIVKLFVPRTACFCSAAFNASFDVPSVEGCAGKRTDSAAKALSVTCSDFAGMHTQGYVAVWVFAFLSMRVCMCLSSFA